MNRVEPAIRVDQSPTRCPYCHDGFDEAALERSVVCHACLSRHHSDCWEGSCASCQSARPLTVGTPATIAVSAPRDASARRTGFERVKHWVNYGWLASFLLCFVALFVALILEAAAPPGPPREPPAIFMITTFLCALSVFPLVVVNTMDAAARKAHDEDFGVGPGLLALGGLLSAGFTSFAYHLVWGRFPLPPPRRPTAPVAARPGEKS